MYLLMGKAKIEVKNLSVGMTLCTDVCTKSGQLVINNGTILTQHLIDKLKYFQIDFVLIDNADETNDSSKKNEKHIHRVSKTHLQRIRESEEFIQFNQVYFEHMKNFETDLKNIVNSSSSKIDMDTLLTVPTTLLNNVGTDIGLFDLLNNIRHLDDSTYAHSLNVAIIASIVGKWLHLSDADLKILTSCGLLHDIGKLMVSESILKKPAKLTKEEFAQIQQHTSLGYSILKNKDIDSRIKSCALLHHEKADGSGYPLGKKRESLPLFSQIITIVDTYEAMTANRVYRQGLCPFEVIKLFEKEGFSKYNVQILLIFLEHLVQTYIGYTAQLTDGRIGEIVFINKMNLSHPIIKIDNNFIDLTKEINVEIESLL